MRILKLTKRTRRSLSRGMTLLEIMVAGVIGSGVTFSVTSISTFIARGTKGIFFQQQSLKNAKNAIETINREIRLATTPLQVFDANGNPASQGNRVEFQRPGDAIVRAFEIEAGPDGDLGTPWDNVLVYDPDISTDENEVEIARGVYPLNTVGAFVYSGATSPLVVQMRTGDPVGNLTPELETMSLTQTGRGTQGMEINITVAPRN